EHGAGLEVVAQSQRVADLVHDDVLDSLVNQVFGDLAARFARRQAQFGNHGRQAQLVLYVAAALADAVLNGPEPGRVRGGGNLLWDLGPTGLGDGAAHEQVLKANAHIHGLNRTDRFLGEAAAVEDGVLVFPEADHVRVEDDVGVEDFASERVGSRRPHGEALA